MTASAPTAFSLSTAGSYWAVSPQGNLTTDQTITVSTVNTVGLSPNTYSGAISIVSGSATTTVQLSLTVTPVSGVSVNPAGLTFTYPSAVGISNTQQLSVIGPSGVQQAFTASASSTGNWLSVTPTSGYAPATLSVSVSPAGLAAGTYTGTITVSPSAGQAVTASVLLTVLQTSTAPSMFTNPTALSFTYAQGSGGPPNQSVLHRNWRKRLRIYGQFERLLVIGITDIGAGARDGFSRGGGLSYGGELLGKHSGDRRQREPGDGSGECDGNRGAKFGNYGQLDFASVQLSDGRERTGGASHSANRLWRISGDLYSRSDEHAELAHGNTHIGVHAGHARCFSLSDGPCGRHL